MPWAARKKVSASSYGPHKPKAAPTAETTYDNTQVTASKNLTVKSGSDTNLMWRTDMT